MAVNDKDRMACAEFEALLGDVLDHALRETRLEDFQAHAAQCAACGPLLQASEAGQHWLKLLDPVAPPVNLVHNILAATSGVEARQLAGNQPQSWWQRLRATWWTPVTNLARQPRFAMSFGMVFFSFSICMSIAGVSVNDLRRLDWRPSALKRNYYETSGRIVKYYENIRFVYEIESRVREFKRITRPAEPVPEEKNNKEQKDRSGQPEPKQDRDYSQGENQPLMAELPASVVAMATHHRRPL